MGIISGYIASTADAIVADDIVAGTVAVAASAQEESGDYDDPVVEVTSPNGSEEWTKESPQTITWMCEDDSTVAAHRIYYSTNSGSSWTQIIGWTAGNPGTYAWTTPDVDSANVRVAVQCRDMYGNIGSDSSDADFTIGSAGDTTPPTITLTDPA